MQTEDIDYRADAVMRGYLAFDETRAGRRPGVLVFHEGLGLGEFVMERARRLAELGYVALAADMFGERRNARNLTEVANWSGNSAARRKPCAAAAAPRWRRSPRCRRSIRPGWRRSVSASAAPWCWSSPATAPISRPPSVFTASSPPARPRCRAASRASVLVLTGADDPLAPPEQVAAFESEMRAAEVRDWQVIAYGNTLHGFTNPAADGSMLRSALYSAQADRRSWASMRSLFDEVLGHSGNDS